MSYQSKVFNAKIKRFLDTHLGIKVGQKKYYGKPILDIASSGAWLGEKLNSGEVFAAGRIGGTELKAMVAYQKEAKDQKERHDTRVLLGCLSGFYGDVEKMEQFVRLMEESISEMDYIGVWYNQMEDYMVHTYGRKELVLGKLEGLEPWYNAENPWSKYLAGKKVVCVHPFKDSIEKQYAKRERLFPGSEILPAFDLRCVAAVQSLGGDPFQNERQGRTWFDALDDMVEETLQEDFDVALIACGAYGLPMAAKLRKEGKTAIHVGGALQLLFGVRGKRWDDFAPLMPFYNDAWERPIPAESLQSADRSKDVEGGCYW